MPVCTSSKASSAPSSSASAAAAATNDGSSGITPPSPSTGSSRINPTSRVAAVCSDRTSFGCAKRTPARSGANGSRFAGCPVTESEPIVRPWKPCSRAITPARPVALRAYFSAASFASAPELQKNACAPPKRSDSLAASARTGSVPNRFEACQSRSSCACAAASGAGCLWPSDTTAIPAAKSRLPAVGVGKARAEPVDERDPARRIRRQQRALQSDAHAVTAVTPISAATPLRTAAAAASSFGTMPPSKVPSSTSAWACRAAIVCTSRPSW